jgi:hypothetical protein
MEMSADIIGHLAWPLTLLLVLWRFEKQIKALLSRLKSVKYGDQEYSFAEEMMVAAALAGPKADEFERKEPILVERYRRFMKLAVEEEGINANGKYRKLKNGLLICNVPLMLKAGQTEHRFQLPAAYSHQVTSIQFVGDADITVLSIRNGDIHISFDCRQHDREIEAISSGV